MSLGPGIGLLFFVIVLNLIVFSIPDSRTPVMEYVCAKNTSGNDCKVIKASTLDYVINARTGAVSWSVRKNAGNYVDTGGIFEKCSVVNYRNWQCTGSKGEVVSMIDGNYRHMPSADSGIVFQGYANGKYRRERIREWVGTSDAMDWNMAIKQGLI